MVHAERFDPGPPDGASRDVQGEQPAPAESVPALGPDQQARDAQVTKISRRLEGFSTRRTQLPATSLAVVRLKVEG